MGRHILAVHTNPVPGREDEFNDWYSNVHLQEVVALPGFVSAQRYKLCDSQLGEASPHAYLALYEIEADDVATALQALKDARPHLIRSDAAAKGGLAFAYTPITDVVTEES